MATETISPCIIDFLRDYGLPLTAHYITITYPETTEYSNAVDVSQNRYGEDNFTCCAFGTQLLYRLWTGRDDFESALNHVMTGSTQLQPGTIYFFYVDTDQEMHFFVLYYPVHGQPLYLGTYGGNNEFYIKPIQVDDIMNLWNPRLAPSTYLRLFDIPPRFHYRAHYRALHVTYTAIPLRPLTRDHIMNLLQDLSHRAIHPNNRREINEMIDQVNDCQD
jgi:hypothetical protein